MPPVEVYLMALSKRLPIASLVHFGSKQTVASASQTVKESPLAVAAGGCGGRYVLLLKLEKHGHNRLLFAGKRNDAMFQTG
ncbi:unknown [Roseburia sp. CAG:380]|nr:unknown [Roseburia sp. CAG:380]